MDCTRADIPFIPHSRVLNSLKSRLSTILSVRVHLISLFVVLENDSRSERRPLQSRSADSDLCEGGKRCAAVGEKKGRCRPQDVRRVCVFW